MTEPCCAVTLISFGYLHGEPPPAEVTLDLRRHFRDPHVSPELRYLTAADEPVRHAVRTTPGILQVVATTMALAQGFLAGPSAAHKPLRIAVGCAGGRHRAASVALEIQCALHAWGVQTAVTHRDLHRPVVER